MFNSLNEIWRFRELLFALTSREVKIRYKQTILGAAWAILQPAALAAIFTIVFSFFLKIDTGSTPYPIFAYTALLPWTFFSTAISFGSLSVVNNANLVTKVYFPREILPFASIGAAFFDFIVAWLVMIPFLIYFDISVGVNLIYLLIIVPAIFVLSVGISLILTTLNVMYRDIKFVVPLVLQIWLYITPIIYSKNQIPPKFQFIYLLNPLAPLVENFRKVLVSNTSPHFDELLVAVCLSVVVFIVGYWFFKFKEKVFADVI